LFALCVCVAWWPMRNSCALIAKFHYTDPRGLCLVGSGRARVVEFSYYSVSHNTDTDGHRAIASTHASI